MVGQSAQHACPSESCTGFDSWCRGRLRGGVADGSDSRPATQPTDDADVLACCALTASCVAELVARRARYDLAGKRSVLGWARSDDGRWRGCVHGVACSRKAAASERGSLTRRRRRQWVDRCHCGSGVHRGSLPSCTLALLPETEPEGRVRCPTALLPAAAADAVLPHSARENYVASWLERAEPTAVPRLVSGVLAVLQVPGVPQFPSPSKNLVHRHFFMS